VGAVVFRIKSKGEEMSKYKHETIEMASFYLEEGMYTIKDLEELIADFKIAKEIQDRHLKNAVRLSEENGEEL
jgi:hypothetical protein